MSVRPPKYQESVSIAAASGAPPDLSAANRQGPFPRVRSVARRFFAVFGAGHSFLVPQTQRGRFEAGGLDRATGQLD